MIFFLLAAAAPSGGGTVPVAGLHLTTATSTTLVLTPA